MKQFFERVPMLHRVTQAIPLENCRVALRFDDGVEGSVDFAQTVQKGGVFTPMRDPAFFARVQIHPGGRFISWPGELEFCADALWKGVRQNSPQPA